MKAKLIIVIVVLLSSCPGYGQRIVKYAQIVKLGMEVANEVLERVKTDNSLSGQSPWRNLEGTEFVGLRPQFVFSNRILSFPSESRGNSLSLTRENISRQLNSPLFYDVQVFSPILIETNTIYSSLQRMKICYLPVLQEQSTVNMDNNHYMATNGFASDPIISEKKLLRYRLSQLWLSYQITLANSAAFFSVSSLDDIICHHWDNEASFVIY